MPRSTPTFPLIAAACIAMVVTLLAPVDVAHADSGGQVPAKWSEGDTFVDVPAATEVQLLKGPGVKRSHSLAKAGSAQWVGKKSTGRAVVSRLFYSFDLSGLPAVSITQVILSHDQIYSPNRTCFLNSYGPAVKVVATGATASKPQWPGPKAMSGSVSSGYALGSRKACVPGRPQTWDVTRLVRDAAQRSSRVHLRLASADEKRKSGYRRYDTSISGTPSLRVYLRPHPDQPTNLRVDNPAPKAPGSPLTVGSPTATIRANLTTPGGCSRTPILSTCLAARYELTGPDGTVVSAGLNSSLGGQEEVADLVQSVGPMAEGLDYSLKVWGVNTQTGLESLEPASAVLRYNARPAAPEVTVPEVLHMGQPILLGVTTHDRDAKQACWQIPTGEGPLAGCVDISPDEPTVVDVGTVNGPSVMSGTVWVVDEVGLAGPGTRVQGTITW